MALHRLPAASHHRLNRPSIRSLPLVRREVAQKVVTMAGPFNNFVNMRNTRARDALFNALARVFACST